MVLIKDGDFGVTTVIVHPYSYTNSEAGYFGYNDT